jgi:hypothetical protein
MRQGIYKKLLKRLKITITIQNQIHIKHLKIIKKPIFQLDKNQG